MSENKSPRFLTVIPMLSLDQYNTLMVGGGEKIKKYFIENMFRPYVNGDKYKILIQFNTEEERNDFSQLLKSRGVNFHEEDLSDNSYEEVIQTIEKEGYKYQSIEENI